MNYEEITKELVSMANDLRKMCPFPKDGKIIRNSIVHFLLRDIIENDLDKIDLYYLLAGSIAKIKKLKQKQ